MTTAAASTLKLCVHTYRYTLRAVIGAHCRFYPTCSDYALEALDTHGALRGTGLAARRILRCHPWNPGGYDPVPRRDNDPVPRRGNDPVPPGGKASLPPASTPEG